GPAAGEVRTGEPGVTGGAAPVGVEVEAEVVTVDTYGNVQVAADAALLASAGMRPGHLLRVVVGTVVTTAVFGITFASVAPGELVVYVDSAGLVALAVNRGSAAQRLAAAAGDPLRLSAARPAPS
ncbi:SAM hydroxide adenosyltransferase, partial [Frankia sp. CiP1_Cm_nod1]